MAAPIQPQHRVEMNAIASVLDQAFNPTGTEGVVFTLFIAEAGKMEGGRVNYISNGHREDMISMVREWLGRVMGGFSAPGGRA